VAKHGNRSSSGGCGSADVLEALGLTINPPFDVVQRSLDEIGWAFLFAPDFHTSTKHAVQPRRELGFRTVFNLLGPLTNPATPEMQIVGVPRPELTGFLARCLKRLGVKRAWVVHGAGLDEISLTGTTVVAALEDGEVLSRSIDPEDAGLSRCEVEALRGGDAKANAATALDVLRGKRGPRRDVVLLNAAAALMVAGRAADLREGVARAAEAIDAGKAETMLVRARELSRS
jgi:anthranilate phosphoribosyltransferase